MDSIRSLQLFVRVLELGSFTAVAREEGTSQPTVSKAIAALERSLGVRLLERTTTQLTPTEAGRSFYLRSKRVIEEYAEALEEARGQRQRLSGLVVVNAPVGLGELRLNGLFLEFLAKYPEINIELNLSDRNIDLVEEGVDLAIRLGRELPPHAVARTIGMSPRVLVATPDYVRRMPVVQRPEDLTAHEYIRFAGLATGNRMEFSNGAERIVVTTQGRYRVNSSLALRQCFLEGVGLGTAPAWLVQDLIDSGDLVRLLPHWDMAPQPLHLVYATRQYQPQRVRVLLAFLAERLAALPGVVPAKL